MLTIHIHFIVATKTTILYGNWRRQLSWLILSQMSPFQSWSVLKSIWTICFVSQMTPWRIILWLKIAGAILARKRGHVPKILQPAERLFLWFFTWMLSVRPRIIVFLQLRLSDILFKKPKCLTDTYIGQGCIYRTNDPIHQSLNHQ